MKTQLYSLNDAYLELTKESDSLSARVLLKHLLKCDDKYLIIQSKLELSKNQKRKIKNWIKLLNLGTPISKITHNKSFFGFNFYVNKNVLCPRPDTETLIEYTKEIINPKITGNILDLGTGSGCLAITLAKLYNNTNIYALDISKSALYIAKKNINKFNLQNRIKLIHSDFSKQFTTKFDIIVSNPPYIPLNDKQVNKGALFDPTIALYAGQDGLDYYKIIAKTAINNIKQNGLLFIEIGINQKNQVQTIFKKNGWLFMGTKKDLGGIDRVLYFQYNIK